MPKYLNSTATVVTIGSLRLEPGETKATLEFIPGALPSGVTQVDFLPSVRPIILSQKIAGSTTVTIPATYVDPQTGATKDLTGNYLVCMYSTGESTIQINGVGVARYLGQEQYFEYRCLSRVIQTLVVTVGSGLVYLSIEAI